MTNAAPLVRKIEKGRGGSMKTYTCDICDTEYDHEDDMFIAESHDVYPTEFAPQAVPAVCWNCQNGKG